MEKKILEIKDLKKGMVVRCLTNGAGCNSYIGSIYKINCVDGDFAIAQQLNWHGLGYDKKQQIPYMGHYKLTFEVASKEFVNHLIEGKESK